MASPALIEQLDMAIDALMAKPERALPHVEPAVMPLLMVAAELRSLPRRSFKTQLKADLLERAAAPVAHVINFPAPTSGKTRQVLGTAIQTQVLPTLFGAGYGSYAVQRRNFAISFVAHTAMILLIALSGTLFVTHRSEVKEHVTSLIAPELSEYIPLSANPSDTTGGGGGGGDRDKVNAPTGRLPRFARDQITPPAMVIRNEHAKLTVEPTVLV